jgi:phospholipid/cholesterol/gamma-HCH transport system permease protein
VFTLLPARDFARLSFQSLRVLLVTPFRFKEFMHQLYFFAFQTAPVVAVCVSFAAVVTIIESTFHMNLVIQNSSLVPGFAALLILRELGVVLACLLATSRVGAGLAAELGTMRITEQLDALKLLGIDPIQYLVVPRLAAGVVGGVMLAIISNAVCLTGAMLISVVTLDLAPISFLTLMNHFTRFHDVVLFIVKGAAFGAVIPLFACFYGFRCLPGAEGVGNATTGTVVSTSVAIIFLDFLLTYIFSLLI